MKIKTNLTKENIEILVEKLRKSLWNITEAKELEPNKFHGVGEILKSKDYESKHMSWFETKKQYKEWQNR